MQHNYPLLFYAWLYESDPIRRSRLQHRIIGFIPEYLPRDPRS